MGRLKPKIAVCTQMMDSIERAFDYALAEGYPGIDFTIDSTDLSPSVIKRLEEVIATDHFEIRYHCAANIEIAQVDRNQAAQSLSFLQSTLERLEPLRPKYFTVHVGLSDGRDLSWETAVANLRELVEYGEKKHIEICVENLKTGWTSEPDTFKKLIELTGAKVTFDIGHANSSALVQEGKTTAVEFLARIKEYVVNAHIYEKEEPHHIAPKDLDLISPQLEMLLQSPCDWWVIELSGEEMVSQTKDLLQLFLSNHR